MIPLSKIITEFEHKYVDKYTQSILPSHKNALQRMKNCRSEASPHMLVQCSDPECQEYSFIPHSCGHRNCPHCQSHEGQQWIDNQLSKQLPAEYYLITFTLPSELRDLAWKNQKLVYTILFFCVQDVLKTFTKNDKKLCGKAGFTAILHTHSRELNFHPHIHVVIPGGSINTKKNLSPFGRVLFLAVFHCFLVTSKAGQNRHKAIIIIPIKLGRAYFCIDNGLINTNLKLAKGTTVVVFLWWWAERYCPLSFFKPLLVLHTCPA